MTTLVPLSRAQKLALKDKTAVDIAEALGAELVIPAPNTFPEIPAPLEATAETRKSFGTLGKIFNKVIVTSRRRLSDDEISTLGQERIDIDNVLALLEERKGQINEYLRNHQDVEAEESGQAFPTDVVRNGNVIAHATERDAKGHYLLAAPKCPVETPIPGTNKKFSNQYSKGRTTEHYSALTEAYENGELDEATYKAVTKLVRVVDPERLAKHVLKTGATHLLSLVIRKGRPSTSMYIRGISKK